MIRVVLSPLDYLVPSTRMLVFFLFFFVAFFFFVSFSFPCFSFISSPVS